MSVILNGVPDLNVWGGKKKLIMMDTIQNYAYVYRSSPFELLVFTAYHRTEAYLAQVRDLFFYVESFVVSEFIGKNLCKYTEEIFI